MLIYSVNLRCSNGYTNTEPCMYVASLPRAAHSIETDGLDLELHSAWPFTEYDGDIFTSTGDALSSVRCGC